MTRDNDPARPRRPRVDLTRWARDVAQTPQKALGIATTAVTLALIARLTLVPRGTELATHFDLCIACGDSGTADFLLNIGLFVPLGAGLRMSGMRRWTAWLSALVLTITIEMLQLYVVPGRQSDLSDIIANAIGAAVGIAAVDLRRGWLTPPAHLSGRLSGLAALLVCTATAAVQWALTPRLFHGVYYEQVMPDLPGYALFDGAVLDATFDGAVIGIGRMSTAASEAMRDSLLTDSAVIAVTMRPGTTRRYVAPIVAVHDHSHREIFLLARRGDDLMFRRERRSDALGFHPPSVVATNAFAASIAQPDTVVARVTTTAGFTTLDVAHRGPAAVETLHQRVGQGVWDAWRLFIPDDDRWAAYAAWLTLASMLLLFAPIGYWAGRAARREGIVLSLTAIVLPIVACFAIIPWAAGAPAAVWPLWAAGLGGAFIAWGVGRWTVG